MNSQDSYTKKSTTPQLNSNEPTEEELARFKSQKTQKYEIPEWLDFDYPTLSNRDNIGKAAVNGQIVYYPKVCREPVDPPIINQEWCNLSFMLLPEPRMIKGKPVYGFVKMRGTYNNPDTARSQASKLIREVDSKFQVRICPMGNWVPISDSDEVVKDLYDVREKKTELHLRDEAIKHKEAQEKRIVMELKEAEENLKTGGDIYDDQDSLKFYTMKISTEMKLQEAYEIGMRKLEETYKKCIETRMMIRILEQKNPQYKDQWLDMYNSERKKSGIPDFIPIDGQFDELNKFVFEDACEKYPEIIEDVTKKMKTYGKK